MQLKIQFNGKSVALEIADKEALHTIYNHGAIDTNRTDGFGATEYLDRLERDIDNSPVTLHIPRRRFDRFLDSLISLRLSLDESLTSTLRSLADGGQYFKQLMRRQEEEWIREHV